jgi:hypothetical protein
MTRTARAIGVCLTAAAWMASSTVTRAASPAASACPTMFSLSGDLSVNPEFEVPDPGVPVGVATCWEAGDTDPAVSAAASWTMHSSNSGARVCSKLVPSTAPGHAPGSYMVAFSAGGNEGGVFQNATLDPSRTYMFSVWVFVRTGQVAIQSNAITGGPVAWSTTHGQWEQLRVCTNSLFSTNALVVYNEDPNGGVFFVDRAQLVEIPTLE